MRAIITIILLLVSLVLNAQLTFVKVDCDSNTLNKIDSIRNTKTPTVLFFCPHNNKKDYKADEVLYDQKFALLQTGLKKKKIDTLNVLSVHTNYSTTKGIFLHNKNGSDSLYVDYSKLECFVMNFDSVFLERANKKVRSNITLFKSLKGGENNLRRLDIIEGSGCPDDLPSRIPGYADFISEALHPTYDIDERFTMMAERLKNTEEKIIELEGIINLMKQNIKDTKRK